MSKVELEISFNIKLYLIRGLTEENTNWVWYLQSGIVAPIRYLKCPIGNILSIQLGIGNWFSDTAMPDSEIPKRPGPWEVD